MGFSEKDLETFKKNVLEPKDTFQFECKMCGNCCRKRSEPIIVTGADVYRIARALNMTMTDVVCEKTEWYIGEASHLPVVVLKERLDGSCKLLRKGRCMVHKDKPAVCALFPLGRFYSSEEKEFYYFMNQLTCQSGRKDGKTWTLEEWLNEFNIHETEEMTKAWNRLIGGLAMATHKMNSEEMSNDLLHILLTAMYLGYDTNVPYIEQVERHMTLLKIVLKTRFNKSIKFD